MNALIIIACISLLLVGCVCMIETKQEEGDINLEEKEHHGPVPIGYNVEHFRETGETIREVSD